ncbi:MAG: hypothetical protein VX741_05255 [Pseudomonadota bacterium]|nr:hypothetical protein [Pseudomonadota bacterium]
MGLKIPIGVIETDGNAIPAINGEEHGYAAFEFRAHEAVEKLSGVIVDIFIAVPDADPDDVADPFGFSAGVQKYNTAKHDRGEN